MNEQQKLEANMACAKLLGRRGVQEGDCLRCEVWKGLDAWIVFDIFTSASQCLEVVKKLGSDYGVCIKPVGKEWGFGDFAELGSLHKQLEEAVAAAAIEVMK